MKKSTIYIISAALVTVGGFLLIKSLKKGDKSRTINNDEPEANKTEPDGSATQKTIAQKAAAKQVFPLKQGVYNNDLVRELQIALGFSGKGADGDWGKVTQLAMEKSGLPKEYFVIDNLDEFNKVIKMLKSSVNAEEVALARTKVAQKIISSGAKKIVANKDNWGTVVVEGKTPSGNKTWANTGETIEIEKGNKELIPYSTGAVSGTLVVKMPVEGVFSAIAGSKKYKLLKVNPMAYDVA